MYKGVCKRERGGVCGGGERAAGGRLHPPLEVFGLAMSPESAIHRPIVPNMPRGPKRHLTTTEVNFTPMPSMWCPPWAPLPKS